MNILKFTTFIIVVLTVSANAQENRPFHAVEKLFAAMSAYDYEGMYAAGTDDFQLLEDGEVWDMARLAQAVKDAEGEIARRNFFAVIKQVESNDSVWISYWNRADLRMADGQEASIAWLESVVVVREGNEWVLQMMHSTGIKGAENLPEGLEMEEYIGRGAFRIGS